MSPGLSISLVAGAYLLGSVSFSVVIVKLIQGLDVRSVGSGNAGATNVLRAAGRGAGVAVLVLDVAKGVTAVVVPRVLDAPAGVVGLLGERPGRVEAVHHERRDQRRRSGAPGRLGHERLPHLRRRRLPAGQCR